MEKFSVKKAKEEINYRKCAPLMRNWHAVSCRRCDHSVASLAITPSAIQFFVCNGPLQGARVGQNMTCNKAEKGGSKV